ncbi:hypothetical protein GCM10009673_11860 [Nesterenkonia sandarakina]
MLDGIERLLRLTLGGGGRLPHVLAHASRNGVALGLYLLPERHRGEGKHREQHDDRDGDGDRAYPRSRGKHGDDRDDDKGPDQGDPGDAGRETSDEALQGVLEDGAVLGQ